MDRDVLLDAMQGPTVWRRETFDELYDAVPHAWHGALQLALADLDEDGCVAWPKLIVLVGREPRAVELHGLRVLAQYAVYLRPLETPKGLRATRPQTLPDESPVEKAV